MAVWLAPRVLAAALALVLIAAVGAFLGGVPGSLVPVSAVVGGLAVVVLLAVAGSVPSPRKTALGYDHRSELHERLSTAVALPAGADAEMRTLQHADALATALRARPTSAYPLQAEWRDLAILLAAAALLGLWLWIGLSSPLAGVIRLRAGGPTAAALPEQAALGEQPAPIPPALAAELRRLQAAIEELRLQLDPDADASEEALQASAEGLRHSSEARRVGRALGDRDPEAAAAELHALATQLSQLNAGQLEELAASLRAAADQAQQDPQLAGRFRSAAEALERNQLPDARRALRELAETVQAIGTSVANNQAVRQQVAALRQQLDEAQAASGVTAWGEGEGGAQGPAGAEGATEVAGAEQADEGSTDSGQTPTGGGWSAARGQERPGLLETLPPEQRLDAEGRLETIQIEPGEEATDTVERPILDLGIDRDRPFQPSAGALGFALGRTDVNRTVPLELRAIFDRYFSSP